MIKFCPKCKIKKSKSEFYRNISTKDNSSYWCKSCNKKYRKEHDQTSNRKEYVKEWQKKNRKNNPEKLARILRKSKLKSLYNITIEEFDKILESQGGKCAICDSIDPGSHGRFNVDHNHETGKVRGLLCDVCNRGLGNFRDNMDILVKAIKYLNKGALDVTC